MDTVDTIIEKLDGGVIVVRDRQVSRTLVEFLVPWSELEAKAVAISDNGARDRTSNLVLEQLWGELKATPEYAQSRRRLFIGLLTEDEVLDGYSGGMLILFARRAGVSDGDIVESFHPQSNRGVPGTSGSSGDMVPGTWRN